MEINTDEIDRISKLL